MAQASKLRPDWERAVALLAPADSIAPSENSKFLLGVAAFQTGYAVVQENEKEKDKTKGCTMAQLAERMFVITQLELPKGAKVQPQTAGQLLGYVAQLTAPVESQKKKFCK